MQRGFKPFEKIGRDRKHVSQFVEFGGDKKFDDFAPNRNLKFASEGTGMLSYTRKGMSRCKELFLKHGARPEYDPSLLVT